MNISPIDFNYVDGLNNYPILDYIDEKTLNNNIYLTSNITNNITSNIYSSNIKITNISNLNDLIYYNANSNLIIANNYPFGEILFKTSYNYPIDNTKLGTKIDYTGKLFVYHNYNILQPTFSAGYYDVESEILALKADGINTDGQLTLLEAAVVLLNEKADGSLDAIGLLNDQVDTITSGLYNANNYNSFRQCVESTEFGALQSSYAELTTGLLQTANNMRANALLIGARDSVGYALAGAALAATVSYFNYNQASNTIYKNQNFTGAQLSNIYFSNINKEISTYRSFYESSSNLSINQSFLNSNITTQQYINNLKCNTITLNNKAITKFSLDNLDDWIKTPNGIYYDITNGTIAINSTPTAIDFFRVGGQTTIQGDFICEKKLIISNTNIGSPTASTNGGIGDKLILRTGGTGLYPYSLGVNTNNMYYSAPTAASHNFYINGSPITTISSTGLSTIGTINASTNLQENSVNLSSKYLQLSGGIMSGDLSFNNRVQDFLIYLFSTNYGFGVNSLALRYNVPFDAAHKFYSGPTNTATISSTGSITASAFVGNGSLLTSIPFSAITSVPSYVLKSGDTMTGQLTGITTLSASTILSSTLSTANNTNVGPPAVGINGGTGDKIFLNNGTASVHPYSIGINTNIMWYSVPNLAAHHLCVNGASITTISSAGLSTIGTINASTNLQENAVNLSSKYLKLDGTNAMTGQLSISTLTYNPLFMTTTLPANTVSIELKNNSTYSAFLGIGCTDYAGNYKNNLFIQSPQSIVLNTNGNGTSATPNMIINSSGNVGIGLSPSYKLHITAGKTSPSTAFAMKISGGYISDAGNHGTLIGLGSEDGAFTKCAIGHVRNDSDDRGDIVFLASNNNGSGSCSMSDEKMRVSKFGFVGIGNTNPFYPLCIGTPSSASDGVLIISKNTGAGANRNFKMGYDTNYYFTMGDFGNANNTTNTWKKNLTIDYGAMSIGMGTTPKVASSLTIYDDTQIKARIILSGQEYYRAGFTSGDGLALFCGVNRDSNKQLWIGNSANLAQNAAKAFVRISAEDSGYIDVTNGDGTGSKPFIIGGSSITLNTDTTINGTTTQNGDINVNNGNIVLSNEGKAVYTPTLVCGGNTLYYTVNWNGTAHSGWFYDLNQHFYSGHAYLTIAIHAMNVAGSYAYCWFGRALLSTFPNGTPPATNGGVISLITDYRNPASYVLNNNYISVAEVLDTSGHSALKITISNAVFGAQFKIKVVG